jgi:hypothetical protein
VEPTLFTRKHKCGLWRSSRRRIEAGDRDLPGAVLTYDLWRLAWCLQPEAHRTGGRHLNRRSDLRETVKTAPASAGESVVRRKRP